MPAKIERVSAKKVLRFVFSELMRFHNELQKHDFSSGPTVCDNFYDNFCFVPGKDIGHYTIGVAANNKLFELSNYLISQDYELAGRVRCEELVQIIKNEMGRMIAEQSRPNHKDFIANCLQKLKSEVLISEEFFIPCIAPQHDVIKKFSVGPVTFHEKRYFFKNYAEKINLDTFPSLEDFESQYEIQNWIAQVKVENFSSHLAEERAYLSVRIAIASFKVLLDPSLSKWLGTRKQTMPDLKYLSLSRRVDGDVSDEIIMGGGRQFILNGSNEEVKHLLSHTSKDWFWLVGTLLRNVVRDGRWDFLMNKLVTAFVWLDIGNSSISDAEKVIAFSNCLESLFVTSNRNIKQQLTIRSSIILEFSVQNEVISKQVEEFYSARSKLVHGQGMPIEVGLRKSADLGKYLTDHCIVGMLYFLEWLTKKHVTLGTPPHIRPFNGRNSFTKALDVELKQFIEEKRRSRS